MHTKLSILGKFWVHVWGWCGVRMKKIEYRFIGAKSILKCQDRGAKMSLAPSEPI